MSTDTTIRQLRLKVPVSDADLASDRLWCAGAAGIEEVDGGDTVELRTVLGGSPAHVRSRLEPIPSTWALEFVEVDKRPAHTWREHARPIAVDAELSVVPAWWDGDMPSSETVLFIEPGDSFGLGDHPTTRLSLAALNAIDLRSARVLDVGCGSGVLGILAARRGAATVTAIDIADGAVEATIDNASRNGVEVEASATPLAEIDATFDVVVANLLAPILISVADDLVRLVAPRGRLVVSGVLEEGFDHVVAALQPLVVVNTRVAHGWAAVELERGPRRIGTRRRQRGLGLTVRSATTD